MTRDRWQSKLIYRGGALLLVVAGIALTWLVSDLGSPSSDQAAGTRAEPFEERQHAVAQGRLKAALSDNADNILRDPDSPIGGNPGGNVTLVEFADYNCPYCRRITPLIAEVERSDPRLRIVYKEIPILGPDSIFAAKAALAAQKQGKYVAFHRALMDVKGVAAEGLVFFIAAQVGLDVKTLRADMKSPSIQAAIDRNLALARTLGINGTPTFIVGDEVISGAIDKSTMRRLINLARAANR